MIAARLPKIRFRKSVSLTAETAKRPAEIKCEGKSKVDTKKPYVILEDYQLPQRFRRQILDEHEINVINNGGCL